MGSIMGMLGVYGAQQQANMSDNGGNVLGGWTSPSMIWPPPTAQTGQTQLNNKKKEENVMGYVKEYFVKHRELIMGLAVIFLLDHFVFKDAFRERLQKLVHKLLDGAEKKIENAA